MTAWNEISEKVHASERLTYDEGDCRAVRAARCSQDRQTGAGRSAAACMAIKCISTKIATSTPLMSALSTVISVPLPAPATKKALIPSCRNKSLTKCVRR